MSKFSLHLRNRVPRDDVGMTTRFLQPDSSNRASAGDGSSFNGFMIFRLQAPPFTFSAMNTAMEMDPSNAINGSLANLQITGLQCAENCCLLHQRCCCKFPAMARSRANGRVGADNTPVAPLQCLEQEWTPYGQHMIHLWKQLHQGSVWPTMCCTCSSE